MASDTTTIKQVLADAAAPLQTSDSGAALTFQLQQLVDQMQSLQTVQQAATDATVAQTQIVKTVTPRASSIASGSSSSEGIGSTLLDVLGSGLGLSPLISGILKLFGGDDSPTTAAAPVRFALPSSVSVNAGVSSSANGPFAVDSAQGGQPRAVTSQQVTVQVNALDSQSFLDHSNDIALAVRQAMLESSVLSDVVREA
jgi:hypothetical protein